MGMLLFLKKITPLSISDLCLANISITDELKYFLIPRIDQKEKKERKLVFGGPPPPIPCQSSRCQSINQLSKRYLFVEVGEPSGKTKS